ncbi:MAG TPA: alpha/beta fold hydrolase [Pirellulales bacterium]|jgi:alpha-beta hydrolase superfamily lysophospholipase|nr:alpha/beta fold hydrolase [Pirellulales bacterium]
MTADATVLSPSLAAHPHLVATNIMRSALYLPTEQGPLFAWLHTHALRPSHAHGVVICPPLGYEQLHAHRSLRHLADALAARQMPVLRFDWHGTGDSAGDDQAAYRVATWIANVREAAKWMTHECGCRQVSIVGLRAGALLAAEAIGDLEVENFVLWAPVTSGRAYVREMTLVDRSGAASSSEARESIEAGGFLVTQAAAADLSKLQLTRSAARCRSALIVARDDLGPDARLADHLAGSGAAVDQIVTAGYAAMMAEPHRCEVPTEAIRAIVDWLDERASRDGPSELMIDLSILGPNVATMSAAGDEPILETAWRLSESSDLFGIVSEPAEPPNCQRPAIVLLNAGSAYRVGPGRLNVFLARQFAAAGYRCLRFDLRGLGDSVIADAERENDCYPATAFADIQLAIDALAKRYEIRRCVLMGLCSGAYAAFQSAAQLDSPTLVESILINPLTFYWNDGMKVDDVMSQQRLADHYSMAAATQWSKWLKFFSGQTRLSMAAAARLLAQRLHHRIASLPRRYDAVARPESCRLPSHPEADDLPGDLRRVLARGRRLAMFVSRSDPGFVILKHHAQRQASRMLAEGTLRVSFIDDADHTFSRFAARRALFDTLSSYLRSRWG